MKQVQISMDLFMDIYKFFAMDFDDREFYDELANRITPAVEDKFRKLANRQLYTKYKTAETEAEREQARQAYLDSVGVSKNFRWDSGAETAPKKPSVREKLERNKDAVAERDRNKTAKLKMEMEI